MTTANPSFSLPDNTSEPVAEDLPCRKCGYNLRGLTRTHRCPECATPVGLSVSGDLLRYADPTWLDKLRRGVNFMLTGILAMFFFVILIAVSSSVRPSLGTAGLVWLIAVPLAAWVLILFGIWFLTVPDPSGLGEDQYGTARFLIRVTLLIGLGGNLIDIANALNTAPAAQPIFQILKFLVGIATIIGFFAQLQYLKKLAMRIPDTKLSGRAKFLMIALPISYGGIILSGLFIGLLGVNASSARTAGCGVIVFVIAFLIFGIMYLFMLERFAKAFKTQSALARQTWSTAT